MPVTTSMTAPLWADMVAALEAEGQGGEAGGEEGAARARLLFGHLSTVGHTQIYRNMLYCFVTFNF